MNLQRPIPPRCSSSTVFDWIFLEEGKIGETRGNNWNEAFTNNKLNPHMAPWRNRTLAT